MKKQIRGSVATYGELILQYPKLVLIIGLILALIASSGMARLASTPDNRVFFGKDNPHLQALEALEDTYTKTCLLYTSPSPRDS